MNFFKIVLLTTTIFLTTVGGFCQQSSKTKAAGKLYEKGGEVTVINTTKINTSSLEFSPAYYQNGIVFVSSRNQQGKIDKQINETYFELFYSDVDATGMPLSPSPFSVRWSDAQHEGPVTFDREGRVLYFTSNSIHKKNDDKKVAHLKIYEAIKGQNDWKDVRALSFNSDNYDCAHPTLSADGKKLFFASNMSGGYGGMDLYFVEKTPTGWSAPINLGSDINTAGNEIFPFIHSSGNLFFSSNGYDGFGGLDIFMIDISSRKWGKVTNLGEPFNSPADDLGLILNPEGNRGYFASSRDGGAGKDDIYLFEAADGIWGRTRPFLLPAMLNVYDANSKKSIEGAEIRIFEKTADGFVSSENDLFKGVLMPADEGSGELVFKLVRKGAGSLNKPDLYSDKGGAAKFDFLGERRYLILVVKEGYKSAELVHSTIGNESKTEISIPMERNFCSMFSGVVKDITDEQSVPNAVIRIKSSCDNKEEVFMADDNGAFDACLPMGCDYSVTIMKENFFDSAIFLENLNTPEPLSKEILLSPSNSAMLSEGSVIVLNNIYYDFDKSHIRKGAARELDDLFTILQTFPSLIIELSSHTDSRGNETYNQKLSQARAESAKSYLVSRGIDPQRITAVGYGESQLRNNCRDGVKCSEAEHHVNRRTEVKILKIDAPVRVQYKDYGPEVINPKN